MTLQQQLEELDAKLVASGCYYIAGDVSIDAGELYFRHDTGDTTVKENEGLYYMIIHDLELLGYELVEPYIEHDCISGTVHRIETVTST